MHHKRTDTVQQGLPARENTIYITLTPKLKLFQKTFSPKTKKRNVLWRKINGIKLQQMKS